MASSTLTSKGQVTIPKEIREAAGLRQGDRLEFTLRADGSIQIRPRTVAVEDLIGIVKTDKRATLEELDAAIREGYLSRWKRCDE